MQVLRTAAGSQAWSTSWRFSNAFAATTGLWPLPPRSVSLRHA